MFARDPFYYVDKSCAIYDDASDLHLKVDTDDVSPEDVTEEALDRIVNALNREFYGA